MGFSAAMRYEPMLHSDRVCAYVLSDLSKVVSALELSEGNGKGNVSLWLPYDEGVLRGAQQFDHAKVTPPIQTYLDMIHLEGRGEKAALADAERPPQVAKLGVEALHLPRAHRAAEAAVPGDHGLGQGCVNPGVGLGLERVVRPPIGPHAPDPPMSPPDPAADRGGQLGPAVDHRVGVVEGAKEATPRVGPELRVLAHPGPDRRMRDLEQEGVPGGDQEPGVAGVLPDDRARSGDERRDLFGRWQGSRRQLASSCVLEMTDTNDIACVPNTVRARLARLVPVARRALLAPSARRAVFPEGAEKVE